MVSEIHNGQAAPIPAPFNMAAYVLDHSTQTPDKTALSIVTLDGSTDWTYGALRGAVLGFATGLLQLGLSAGDTVLLRLGNSVDFPIAYLATIAVGMIPVPTSAQLTVPEVTRIAKERSPSLIVSDGLTTLPDGDFKLLTTDQMHPMYHLPPAKFRYGEPNRPAYMIYTSGTSGQPRAVLHAHHAVWARRMMWDGWMGLKSTDRVLHAGAFNWTYTLGAGLMDPWAIGATSLIPDASIKASDLPQLLSKHHATIFAAAPGVYRQMLRSEMPALPDLRHGLSAGEKMPPQLHTEWNAKTGTHVYEAFGMSECSTFISSSPAHPVDAASLGYPQSGRHVAIINENGPVAFGDPGDIAIDRDDPGLMLEYPDAPDETRAKFQGRWFKTGDTATMHADGAVTYLGRSDDMMNAGGYRVSPIEVESAMRLHPDITDCAATEVDIKTGVRVIAAFYESGEPINETDLTRHAETHLARYKQPRLFVHRTDLPRGNNNKLARKQLRDQFTIT